MDNNTMTYKQLGKSNLHISRLGFGCMSLKQGQPNFGEIINRAINKGINFFDTADIYDNGANEVAIGNALKNKRKQVIIATKVGNQPKPDGSGLMWNPSKKHILTSVENSLLRLQTDYIDLYQLHGGTIEDNIDETIDAFEILQQQGKIRYYGISSIRPNVIKAYVERSNIVSVMMQYSLLDRRPEETCLDLLQKNNIGVLARGSVAGGLLAGKKLKPYLNYQVSDLRKAAEVILHATDKGGNAAATAIAFTLNHPAITSAVLGVRTIEQLMEALSAVEPRNKIAANIKLISNTIAINYYDQHL